ncbi:multicopper oxidase family protein [Derxia gummosa]|uniref:Multicopper oxidase family protein n=1 Tax=Derxia gummosa DSM 723 TaxID=1121388 RepID=A0A8B6XAI5_9BURK|nr:multicopper oxidase domain-containing protein [Derxia gummosa]
MPPSFRARPRRAPALHRLLPLALALAAGAGHAAPAQIAVDPPVLTNMLGSARSPSLQGRVARGGTAEQVLDLSIKAETGVLLNPSATDPAAAYQRVRLRSYQDRNKPRAKDAPMFVAPTIDIEPAQTVRITLHNDLDPEAGCDGAGHAADPNKPHCFNNTNLHSHGLWVSPAGNSDNVLLNIRPDNHFQYEYNVPADHPAGTFWYHTHVHGSTALQVSSGMAGALIVRGNRQPVLAAPGVQPRTGDLDTLLKDPGGKLAFERVVLLQQIAYACPVVTGGNGTRAWTWNCTPGQIGEIESYEGPVTGGVPNPPVPTTGQFGPNTWANSGRYTSINGIVWPWFEGAVAGRLERWRVIHGGVRDSIGVEFRRAKPGLRALLADPTRRLDKDKLIADACTDTPLRHHVAASDGLTMGAASSHLRTVLQPGYRNDLLVTFPEEGDYCVLDIKPANGTVDRADFRDPALGGVNVAKDRRAVLGFVHAGKAAPGSLTAGSPGPDGDDHANERRLIADSRLRAQLTRLARLNITDRKVRAVVIDDIDHGLKLTQFIPHPTVTDGEIAGRPVEKLSFLIQGNQKADGFLFQVGGTSARPDAPPESYVPSAVPRQLLLGTAQQWELESWFVGHPFHIHVNPFQIVKVLNPDGVDVSEPDTSDCPKTTPWQLCPSPAANQYAGLKGVWKDTIWLENSNPPGPPPAYQADPKAPSTGVYKIFVRTRYERYIGEFVLHCHILDHEDQGMMQNVSIVLPDGTPTTSPAAAHGHHH